MYAENKAAAVTMVVVEPMLPYNLYYKSYDIIVHIILKIRDKNSRLEYYNDMTACKAHDRCNCISSRYLWAYKNIHGDDDDDNNDEKIFCSS